jgi:hypothetical protein
MRKPASFAAALIGSVLAHANAQGMNLSVDCSVQPSVYDAHNNKIGITPGVIETLLRPINTKWYALQFSDEGLNANALFYYTDTACASVPYFQTGYIDGNNMPQYLPLVAKFDGQAIWGPSGPVLEISYKSYRYPTTSSYCNVEWPQGSGPMVARQATIIDTTTFYAPFRVQ